MWCWWTKRMFPIKLRHHQSQATDYIRRCPTRNKKEEGFCTTTIFYHRSWQSLVLIADIVSWLSEITKHLRIGNNVMLRDKLVLINLFHLCGKHLFFNTFCSLRTHRWIPVLNNKGLDFQATCSSLVADGLNPHYLNTNTEQNLYITSGML